ncbi:MAG: YIP1 family protein [Clostridiales bacterium]|jgi:hypothetical protein|nr:YIP1 family protein [Clostridiales bacterium]
MENKKNNANSFDQSQPASALGKTDAMADTEHAKPFKLAKRLKCLFTDPARLMKNLKVHPVFGPPALVFILVAVISSVFFMGKLSELQARMLSEETMRIYGASVMAETQFQAEGPARVILIVSQFIGVAAIPYVMGFVLALPLLIIGKIAGGKAKLSHYYSLSLHAYALTMLVGLISTAGFIMTDSLTDILSLGLLDPTGGTASVPHAVLQAVSITNLWQCGLIYFGMKEINGFKPVKAAVAAAVIFVLIIISAAGGAVVTKTMIDITHNLGGAGL